ncbi:RNA polymerase subunit sigma-70 [Shigella sonnei]|nr:RNA polymerase subunit sigma-70 [Shigella sonnei]
MFRQGITGRSHLMSQNTLKVHDLNEDAEFDENGVEVFDETSVDTPLGGDSEKALLDILADEKENGPEDTTQDDDMKQSIVKWLFELNAKQREVLARRFGLLGYEAATLEDVGREIGLTRERVRQIQVEGLRRLREILQTQGLNIEALFRE